MELLTDNTKHPEEIKTGSNSQKREYTLGKISGIMDSRTPLQCHNNRCQRQKKQQILQESSQKFLLWKKEV